jgi:hypothetical protein
LLEADAWFFHSARRIGIKRVEKISNFQPCLFVARLHSFTWLDVVMHFRLHAAHPENLTLASKGSTAVCFFKHTRVGQSFGFRGGNPKITGRAGFGKCHFSGALAALYHSLAQMQDFSTDRFSVEVSVSGPRRVW